MFDRKAYMKEYMKTYWTKYKPKRKEYLRKNKERIAKQWKKWRENNKDKIREIKKRYRLKHLDKVKNDIREWKWKKVFGITANQHQEMLIKQDYKCKICGIHQSKLKRILAVDHNHSSGKVRGLLCSHCNTGLGYFRDSIELLEKAINYLKLKTSITSG